MLMFSPVQNPPTSHWELRKPQILGAFFSALWLHFFKKSWKHLQISSINNFATLVRDIQETVWDNQGYFTDGKSWTCDVYLFWATDAWFIQGSLCESFDRWLCFIGYNSHDHLGRPVSLLTPVARWENSITERWSQLTCNNKLERRIK